ncbi:hypothetical protein [Paludibaculum fermentans]|uniref:hypothetical protein n=1 Tax=Paludibaculum fermentans TaxID=1473598 RepID=UPI003EC0C8F3
MPRTDQRSRILRDAWIGDAILCLYARELILREGGRVDGEWYTRMTSNQFLGQLGEPSEVEARIGRAYESGGLAGAFTWLDENLLPLYRRQEAKRQRASGGLRPIAPAKIEAASK